MRRRYWRAGLTGAEQARGWVFFLLCVFVFPFVMALVQRSSAAEWPAAEANLIYYLLLTAAAVLLLWRFLRYNFDLLLDWLPENLFAFATGLLASEALRLLVVLLPYPVENPNRFSYAAEYLLSPRATAAILVLLMPLLEEILFRGILFGSLRGYSRGLAWTVSAAAYCLFCVWQFAFSSAGVDLRYLTLALQYLPMSLALTWCYDMGGSIWSAAALHAVINAFALLRAAGG